MKTAKTAVTRRPLRIAQITNTIERVPPKKYGGTERVISALKEELVRRGHDVTLFASGDSITSAKLVSIYPKALREIKLSDLYGANAMTLLNIGLAYQRQHEFDIIHDHTAFISLPTANMAAVPVVATMHGAFTVTNRRIFEGLTKPHIVTISHAQAVRKKPLNINHAGTVYNELPIQHYPFSKGHDGYLLFVGRISPEKGLHAAIEVAQQINLPLIIAAKLDEDIPIDVKYFEQYVKPKLSLDLIKWVGEVEEEERNRLMSRAMCILHPVMWREPFGLTMIEAMACGCPVIAFNKGSIPEVVNNGVTGFVVEDAEEMLEAVGNIASIDRAECRRWSLENFSDKKMADGYEEIYYKILEEKK